MVGTKGGGLPGGREESVPAVRCGDRGRPRGVDPRAIWYKLRGTFVAARDSHNHDSKRVGLDFQSLVECYHEPLSRFAMSLTRAEQDAADLVQETFLIWAAKGHQLQDLSKVKAWLFTTLHRCFLASRRRGARFPQVELTSVDAELPSVAPEQMTHLDARQVVELLGQVEPQFQAAVALFYLEDYSYREIADILEVPLGTVKSRIARGLAQLKALLARSAAAATTARKGGP